MAGCAAVEDAAMVALLLNLGADPSRVPTSSASVLHAASRYGRSATVAVLLSHGARVDAAGHGGIEPLSVAGTAPVIRSLLDAGADVSVKDHYALYWASGDADPACFELLLDAGGDLDAHLYGCSGNPTIRTLACRRDDLALLIADREQAMLAMVLGTAAVAARVCHRL